MLLIVMVIVVMVVIVILVVIIDFKSRRGIPTEVGVARSLPAIRGKSLDDDILDLLGDDCTCLDAIATQRNA